MLLVAILCAHLAQVGHDRSIAELIMTNSVRVVQAPDPLDRVAELRRRQLEQRYHKLVTALKNFADAYDRGQGHVLPLKEADSLRKACRDLERSLPSRSGE